MEKNERLVVEAIKLSVMRMGFLGLSAQEVIKEAAFFLCEQYRNTDDKRYLKQAWLQIQAFLELGFQYEKYAEQFDFILDNLKVDKEKVRILEKKNWKKILLNKAQVRSMLGRWNPKLRSMPINQVVDDIMQKVSNHEVGIFYYWSEQNMGRDKYRDEYELHIQEDETFFYDVKKNCYYTLAV